MSSRLSVSTPIVGSSMTRSRGSEQSARAIDSGGESHDHEQQADEARGGGADQVVEIAPAENHGTSLVTVEVSPPFHAGRARGQSLKDLAPGPFARAAFALVFRR